MFGKKRSPKTSVVGLELDPGHLAAAEVSVNGKITLTRGAVAELRPGIIREGEVADPIALAEALKALFAENELPKRVRLGIAHQRIVVRTLDLDAVVDDLAVADDAGSQLGDRAAGQGDVAVDGHLGGGEMAGVELEPDDAGLLGGTLLAEHGPWIGSAGRRLEA